MNVLGEKKEIPFLIPTLSRYRHFVECVESLKKNNRSEEIRLVIALDYPLNDKHWEGYQKICTYLEQGFVEFHSTEIIKRNTNFGAAKNFRTAREYLFQTYDRMICSEDDNVFSPNFLDYMLKGFELYENREEVFAICGYSYPVNWIEDPNTIIFSSTQFSAWGYGIWRERYLRYYTEYNECYLLELVADNRRLMKLRRKCKNLFFYLISDIGEKNIQKGDCGISIYITDKEYRCVMPKKSLVRNMGWDGSGIHCHEKTKYNFSEQIIDENTEFEYEYIDNTNEVRNMVLLAKYFELGIWKNIRVVMQYVLFKIVGKSKYIQIKVLAKRILRRG